MLQNKQEREKMQKYNKYSKVFLCKNLGQENWFSKASEAAFFLAMDQR